MSNKITRFARCSRPNPVFYPRSSAAKTDDGFDVMSLWEKVETKYSVYDVTAGEEFFEIACKCGRVAGDVGDCGGSKIENALDYCRLGAGSWWIQQDEVGGTSGIASEPIGDCCCNYTRIR